MSVVFVSIIKKAVPWSGAMIVVFVVSIIKMVVPWRLANATVKIMNVRIF
jgi:hypothetical protein